MSPTDKLYVVVRADLDPGMQVAQACHAAIQFALDHPALLRKWFETSNHICVLNASGEMVLNRLLDKSSDADLVTSAFKEPDLGSSLTAIVLEPGRASRICKKLKLALSGLKRL